MPRSIWRGAISFGLVNVPVKLYSAVSKKTVRFNQLHETDGARIQQKRVCSEDGEEVPFEEIVKGYEISPDRYVVITPEELEALDPKKTRTIDIEDFVDLDEIDPLYYEHPYYLVPDTGAAKAYKLLLEALRETNKVAIARVVIRSKEYLTAIRPRRRRAHDGDDAVRRRADRPERASTSCPTRTCKATEREVDMARQLIESLATEFDPSKYRDEYRERVLELIERKAEGEEIAVAARARGADRGAGPDGGARGLAGGRRRQAAEATAPAAKKRRAKPARAPAEEAGRQARRTAKKPRAKTQGDRARPTGRRGRGRGPPPQALEPRQGLLSGRRLHQGPGDRLLHARRPGAAAAPARPAADAEALSGRRRGPVLLREAVPVHRPDWVKTVAVEQAQQARDRLLPRRTTCRRWSGSRTSPTSSCTRRCRWRRTSMRPTMMVFDLDPGAPGRDPRVRAGRALAARDCSATSGSRASRRPPARRASRSTCR